MLELKVLNWDLGICILEFRNWILGSRFRILDFELLLLETEMYAGEEAAVQFIHFIENKPRFVSDVATCATSVDIGARLHIYKTST